MIAKLPTPAGVTVADAVDITPAPGSIARIPRSLAIDCRVLPIELKVEPSGDETLVLASPHAQRYANAQASIQRSIAQRREDLLRSIEEAKAAQRAGSDRVVPLHQGKESKPHRLSEDESAIVMLRTMSQCDALEFVHADAAHVQNKMIASYGEEAPRDQDALVNEVNELLRSAIYRRFTDIETKPLKHGGTVEGFVDDQFVLLKKFTTTDEYSRFVNIIKNRAAGPNLQPGTANVPQDGQFVVELPHRAVNIRVNVMPMHRRESLWLRLHDLDIEVTTPERLRIPKSIIQALDEAFMQAELESVEDHDLNQSRGVVFFVGRQREGKSTTVESIMVHRLIPRGKRCAEVGNPIERVIHEIAQYEVNERSGMSFEDISRALKRRRYFFTFIAEGRDKASVQAAFSASANGNLTGQTLHAGDALGSYEKLLTEFEVPMAKLIEHVKLVIAQRLLRRLCADCKEPMPAPDSLVRFRPAAAGAIIYRPVGCEICNQTGYRREFAVFEKHRPTRRFWEALAKHAIIDELYDIAKADGYRSMFEDALDRVLAGETSMAEVIEKVPKPR